MTGIVNAIAASYPQVVLPAGRLFIASIPDFPAGVTVESHFATDNVGISTFYQSPPAGDVIQRWLFGNTPGIYEIRADLVSGSVSGSATATWLGMGAVRDWWSSRVSAPGGGATDAVISVSVRHAASGVVVVPARNYTLRAQVVPP